MKSASESAGNELDLERGIRTLPDDVRALRALRPQPMSLDAYVAFLRQFPPLSTEALALRRGPRGTPFRLGDEG